MANQVDLNVIKENKGVPHLFTLISKNPALKKVEHAKGSFNIWVFDVVDEQGQSAMLEASDSLKRKLEVLLDNQRFYLSYEEFTKEGQLRHFWKVQTASIPKSQTKEEKPVNEFEEKLKQAKTTEPVVKKFTNEGARFGMIFNNTFKLYMHFDMSWTTDEFVENFNRISEVCFACEEQKITDQDLIDDSDVELKEEDLPFNDG